MDNEGLLSIKIAICDDDKVIHKVVEEALQLFETDVNLKLELWHAYSAMELLEVNEAYNILLLDIEMPEMDGIQVKNMLQNRGHQIDIVFMTSHDERVMEAFGRNVVGFLTKPLDKEQLLNVLGRIIHKLFGQVIGIEIAGKCTYIRMDEIRYIQGQDKYTEVVTKEDRFLMRKSLTEWERLLPPSKFCRVNRSHIIHFELFNGRKNDILLDDGKIIKLSRNNRRVIIEKYRKFLRDKIGEIC